MKTRLLTGILLVAIFLPLIAVAELFILFQILIVGLVAGATYEMIRLFETKEKFSLGAKIVIYISTLLIYFSLLREWNLLETFTGTDLSEESQRLFTLGIGFTPMIMLVTLIVLSLLVFNEKFDGGTVGRVLTIILYVGLSFAAVTILRYLGIRFIVYLFLITILTDVFAYVFGVKFGKHKMAPKISPKKSWEGAIGGSAVATIVVTAFATFYGVLFYDLSISEFASHSLFFPVIPLHEINSNFLVIIIIFFITLGLSVAGQLGDLIASKFKRTYDIKDFGKIFPGHGGILDRLDSAMVASLLLVSVIILVTQIAG